jgi:glycosyltransferase involved in cell wall biosynthesis
MRITILQGPFLPVPPIYGGAVEKLWFAMGKEFFRLGNEVTHISKQNGNSPLTEVISGVKHIRINGFIKPPNSFLAKIFDFIYSLRAYQILPPADFLITNTFFMPLLPVKKENGRVVASVERMPRGQLRFYRNSVYFRANSTPVLKAILKEIPSAISRSFVVPNPLPYTLKNQTSWKNKKKTILYVGRIHPEKGIDILLEAFDALNNCFKHEFKLKIIGPSSISYGGGGKDYESSLNKKYSHIKNVEWIGPIFDDNILAKEYSQASFFVYPSVAEKGETFGLAPLEAMSYCCIPIVSNLECFKDFVHNGQNGFIFNHYKNPVENLQCIFNKLIKMNEAELEYIISKVFMVCHTHSIERISEKFIEEILRINKTK